MNERWVASDNRFGEARPGTPRTCAANFLRLRFRLVRLVSLACAPAMSGPLPWLLAACAVLLPQSTVFAGKVTFRDDHTVLVDGKPFFPIGLYYTSEEFEDPTGQKLKALKDLGFNTLGYYREGG